MSKQMDLVGKTISGIVASPVSGDGRLKIWMLQFSDGTHVEFVSPGARRTLRELTGGAGVLENALQYDPQLALNVA